MRRRSILVFRFDKLISWNVVATCLELERAGQLDVAFVPVFGNDCADDDNDDHLYDDDEDVDEHTCPQGGVSAGACESRDRKHGSLSLSPSPEQPSLRKSLYCHHH